MPDELAAAVKLMVALPALPDVWFNFSQPKPIVSTLHAALQVNVSATVPPPDGMVSVVLESESTGAISSLLQETTATLATSNTKIIKKLLRFILFELLIKNLSVIKPAECSSFHGTPAGFPFLLFYFHYSEIIKSSIKSGSCS
jgi:hypothetical protein